MKQYQGTSSLILKAVAVGVSAAVLVLDTLQVTAVETSITLLAIGLFALTLVALQRTN